MTFVFVTHDQQEALAMSDRIVVMNHRNIQQIGRAEQIYQAPDNAFVAEFIGQQTFFSATGQKTAQDHLELDTPTGTMGSDSTQRISDGCDVRIDLRQGDIRFRLAAPTADTATAANQVAGRIVSRSFLGDVFQYLVHIEDGTEVLVRVPASAAPDGDEGDLIVMEWHSTAVRVFANG